MTFRISKDAIEKRSALLANLNRWITAFAILATLFALLFVSVEGFAITGFFMLLFWVVGFLALRRNIKELAAYTIELNSDSVTCQRIGFPDVCILRQNIQRVWEVKDPALMIEDLDGHILTIPYQIENLEILRGILINWCPLSASPYESKARAMIVGTYSFIVVLILVLILQSSEAFLLLSAGWFVFLFGLRVWEKTRPHPRTGVRDWSSVLAPLVAIALVAVTVFLFTLLWK